MATSTGRVWWLAAAARRAAETGVQRMAYDAGPFRERFSINFAGGAAIEFENQPLGVLKMITDKVAAGIDETVTWTDDAGVEHYVRTGPIAAIARHRQTVTWVVRSDMSVDDDPQGEHQWLATDEIRGSCFRGDDGMWWFGHDGVADRIPADAMQCREDLFEYRRSAALYDPDGDPVRWPRASGPEDARVVPLSVS